MGCKDRNRYFKVAENIYYLQNVTNETDRADKTEKCRKYQKGGTTLIPFQFDFSCYVMLNGLIFSLKI
jgi:hypothetical protein